MIFIAWVHSSVGRAPRSQRGGRGFESPWIHHKYPLPQTQDSKGLGEDLSNRSGKNTDSPVVSAESLEKSGLFLYLRILCNKMSLYPEIPKKTGNLEYTHGKFAFP